MTRAYEKSDYPMLCSWLTHYGIALPDPNFFSDTGIVVDDKAIGFLFTTNSKSSYIDHVAANPYCKKEERDQALDTLFSTLEDLSRSRGFEVITALAKLDSMRKRFERHAFVPFDSYMLYYKTFRKDHVCHG